MWVVSVMVVKSDVAFMLVSIAARCESEVAPSKCLVADAALYWC